LEEDPCRPSVALGRKTQRFWGKHCFDRMSSDPKRVRISLRDLGHDVTGSQWYLNGLFQFDCAPREWKLKRPIRTFGSNKKIRANQKFHFYLLLEAWVREQSASEIQRVHIVQLRSLTFGSINFIRFNYPNIYLVPECRHISSYDKPTYDSSAGTTLASLSET
jgi:hypothetical protein